MLQKNKFVLFLLFCGPLVFGQGKIDSLKTKLANEQKDSIRFEILLKLSKESEFYDYAAARQYAEDAALVAAKINANWSKGKLLLRQAFLETMQGDYAEALKYDLEAMNLNVETKDSLQLAYALNDVGTDYRDLGEYEEGYLFLTQSYRVAVNHHKVPRHEDSLMMAIALHNIGTVFTELGQFDIALGHLQASMKISTAIHDTEGQPYSFDELGELYRRKNDYEQSEKYLVSALKQAREMKIKVLIPRIQAHLASLYLDKKEFTKSLAYYDSVIVQQAAINNRFGLAECDLGKAMVMSRSENFKEALSLYSKSLRQAKEVNARNLELQAYKELASLYEVKNDYLNSLQYLKQYNSLRDSIFSESTMEKLFQNQVRFETENKDTEIAALSKASLAQTSEMKRQDLITNILVIVIALTAILLFTVYRSSSRRKRINVLLLEHQEEIKKRSVELEQLNQVKDKFFSIISHDLRSPMNALAGTLDLLEQRNISQEEFVDLSKTLRIQFNHTRTLINNLLDWTLLQMEKLNIQPEKVLLYKKVEESFSALKTLYPKNILMENHVGEKISVLADPNIVNLVLRNLILNAVKFTESGGHIWIDATEGASEITVSVSDDGIGIKPEVKEMIFEKTTGYSTRGTANEKGTGLGLILCKEFVEKNGGKIWLESEVGKGTTFFFTLPRA